MGSKTRDRTDDIKRSNQHWKARKHVYDPSPRYCGDPRFMLEAYDHTNQELKARQGQIMKELEASKKIA